MAGSPVLFNKWQALSREQIIQNDKEMEDYQYLFHTILDLLFFVRNIEPELKKTLCPVVYKKLMDLVTEITEICNA